VTGTVLAVLAVYLAAIGLLLLWIVR